MDGRVDQERFNLDPYARKHVCKCVWEHTCWDTQPQNWVSRFVAAPKSRTAQIVKTKVRTAVKGVRIRLGPCFARVFLMSNFMLFATRMRFMKGKKEKGERIELEFFFSFCCPGEEFFFGLTGGTEGTRDMNSGVLENIQGRAKGWKKEEEGARNKENENEIV